MSLAAALGLALAACRGGGAERRDPDGTTFGYGAERTPTGAEATAAGRAAAAAVGTMGLAGEAGTSSAPEGACAEVTTSMTTGDTLPGGAVFASSLELAPATIAQLSAVLLQRGLAADWTQGCWTATASQVAFDACPLPIDDPGVGPLTGALTLRGPVDLSAGVATWAATVDVHLVDGELSVTGLEDLSGSIAWTDTTLAGRSRMDVALTVHSYGQGTPYGGMQSWHEWHTLTRAVTYDTDYDLTYVPASVCAARITGGTITVKRLWAVRPVAATGDAFTDASLRFTWSGCGDVSTNLSVARSWEAI
jgi:hypothetical protein